MYTPSASAAAAALGGPERRGRTLSFVLGGLAAGTVFGVPIGTAIGQQLSWQATLVFVAAVGTIAILGLAITPPELARPLLVPMRERLRLLVDRRVLVIVAVNALATAGGILVYTYIAPILGENAHITGLLLAGTLIAWGVGGCVGAFGSGWLIDRIGSERTIVLGITVLAVTLIALGFATRAASVAPIMVLFGASAWAVTTPNNHRLTALAPALPSVAISYNSSGIYRRTRKSGARRKPKRRSASRATTDPHPNPKLRVIGTLSNMPEFQAAFKCAATDKMVRKNACRIW